MRNEGWLAPRSGDQGSGDDMRAIVSSDLVTRQIRLHTFDVGQHRVFVKAVKFDSNRQLTVFGETSSSSVCINEPGWLRFVFRSFFPACPPAKS